jgi:D-alanyl-D-alanine carboxypeptidase
MKNGTKKRNRSLKAMALAAMLLLGNILWGGELSTVEAEEYWPDSVSVESGAAIVVEMETGTVLYEKNADQSYYPASITKIMTAMLALENCSLDEEVTFSAEAVYKNEGDTSHIARDVGEVMTMEQCLYGMMLESANECAWAIGEHVAGDMDSFVEMMNAKAAELGCTNTHFANPNGLPDEDHYVSARDMALIARAAYEIPKFQEICGTRSYNIPPTNKHSEVTYCNNTHAMFSNHRTSQYLYEYTLGGKTGYTDEAGNTLVTFARKDGLTLLCVVLNAKSPAHYTDTIQLFDYCFYNFSTINISENVSLASLNENNDTGLLGDTIDLIYIDPDAVVVLPNTASFSDAVATVSPVSDDSDAVAQITYTYASRVVGTANLYFEQSDTSSYPFHNLSEEEGGSSIAYIRIGYRTFLLILFIIAVLALLIWFLSYKSSDMLLYMHRRKERRQEEALERGTGRPTSNRRRRRSTAKDINTKKSMSGNARSGIFINRNYANERRRRIRRHRKN